MGYSATHGRYATVTIPALWFDDALANFPVLFTIANLPSESFDADGSYPARSDGADRRFSSDADGDTPWNREIVAHGIDANPASGTAEIWSACPLTSASVDVTAYHWYNDPDASEPSASDSSEGSQAVWDSNFVAVWHMQEAVNNDADGYEDSTANAIHGQGSSMAVSESADPWGSGGLGQNFDGSADQISMGADATITALESISVSAWIKPSSTARGDILGQWGGSIRHFSLVHGFSAGKVYFLVSLDGSGLAWSDASSQTIDTSNFWHVAGTYDQTAVKCFVNGAQGNSQAQSGALYTSSTLPFLLGASDDDKYAGFLGEARISSSARSAAWLLAEYNTGNAPGDVTVGTPASPGGGGGLVGPLVGGHLTRSSLIGGRLVA